jgi:hypothetical protein
MSRSPLRKGAIDDSLTIGRIETRFRRSPASHRGIGADTAGCAGQGDGHSDRGRPIREVVTPGSSIVSPSPAGFRSNGEPAPRPTPRAIRQEPRAEAKCIATGIALKHNHPEAGRDRNHLETNLVEVSPIATKLGGVRSSPLDRGQPLGGRRWVGMVLGRRPNRGLGREWG